jgi:hypothetical protein
LTTSATASNNDNNGTASTAPVIAGLAIGIAFVLAFSVFMNVGGESLLKSKPTVSLNTSQQEAMLERGNVAMGFDQDKIMHHFMATSTGGRIMIVSLQNDDSETITQIKDHVIDIRYEFSQGNFTKPFFIHDEHVPGTDIMAKKKDMIRYSIEQMDNGSALMLKTDDKELLSAIQQFMQYQGMEHKGH